MFTFCDPSGAHHKVGTGASCVEFIIRVSIITVMNLALNVSLFIGKCTKDSTETRILKLLRY